MLPDTYGDLAAEGDVPSKYTQMGANLSQYNRVFGDHAKNRMSASVARAVRAQAALLAASPAYSEGSGVTWEQAANFMAEVLKIWVAIRLLKLILLVTSGMRILMVSRIW